MKYYFSRIFKSIKDFSNYVHKGFTLLETLITVGILVILFAISIPSVVTIQKNLKMQELDDIARQIFLASQGELTEMKSGGRLDIFRKELTDPSYKNQNLGILNKKPADYEKVDADKKDDGKWKDFYYLNATDVILQKHVIREVSSLRAYLEGGSFIVELNPETGDVYSAFYSQKPSLSYDDVLNLLDRSRTNRAGSQIGYYGGEGGSSASSTLPTELLPKIDVVNDEDLYLKLECSNLQSLLRTQGFLKLTVSAIDEDGSATEGSSDWEKVFTGGTDFFIDATGNTRFYVLLDSLRQHEGFEELTDGKLKVGDNIKITAKLEYNNKRDPIISGSTPAIEVNSLFAKKEVVDGATQLGIAKLRHINNLRSTIYKEVNLPAGKITLNQSLSIDFDVNNWAEGAVMPTKGKPSLTSFSAITNKTLLERSMAGDTTYNGNGNSLLSFPLAPADGAAIENVGLFATAKNMTFNGMRIIDFSAKGSYNNVGMLAGKLTSCKVTDVWAHLSTEDSDGRPHGTNMPNRLLKYSINANNNVGGLIGLAEGNTEIDGSFAAVPTTARNNVGGMVGSFAGGKITNSYGTGNITASSYAGGICGIISGSATVTNCYSTSNVTANSYAGGLVGRTAGAAVTFSDDNSYGLVEKSDKTTDLATSGPFVGSQAAANSYNAGCRYLRQGTYNNYDASASGSYGTPTGYVKLVPDAPNSVANSHPYMQSLFEKTFPFTMVSMGTGASKKLLPHYGDWMETTTMQTSLVYYERYSNGEYGYYAKTSLKTIGSEGGEDGNLWHINTLRDEYCVEDGYALMTIFKLTNFKYRLDDGAQENVTIVEDAAEAGPNKAVLIQSNVTVEFTKGDLSQTIANARVYQLPFSLQIANRSGAAIKNFFLKLNIYGYVGSDMAIDNFNFYYCPDFAKNAVNPELGNTDINVYPKDPSGEENPVFVRSPRHLNGLSRYIYYWNESNSGTGRQFYFKQETELDYSKYETNYCGVTYDLMDTSESNPYRNQPIGRPTHQEGSQFRNIYDGNYKKIIDYRCESYVRDHYQFVGLFGEVRGSILKNIILTASKPGEEGVPSSAYIKSYFTDPDNYCVGVGALVGLVFVAADNDYNSNVATVSNCVVSGYDVEGSAKQNRAVSVGGLAGYNFGIIENSSANNKTVVADTNNYKERFLGGLVGSVNGRSRIENCYAGGVLESNAMSNLYIGGLVGGFSDISGFGFGYAPNRSQKVINSYSHCTWKEAKIGNGKYYPCAPIIDEIDVTNCYYLTNSVEQSIAEKFDTATDTSEGKDSMALSEMAAKPSDSELPMFGKAKITYPWLIKGKNYPYPAIAKNKAGELVHYGDWHIVNESTPSAIFTYYEKYHDNTYSFQFAQTSGVAGLRDNLKGNAFGITEAGHGVLVLDKEKSLANVWVNGKLVGLDTAVADYTTIKGEKYKLQPLNSDDFSKALETAGAQPNVTLQYNEIKDGVTLEKKSQGLYVNFNFAAGVALKQLPSSSISPIQVRTERQLRNLSSGKAGENYKLTHNIVIENFGGITTGNLVNDGYVFDGGYAAGGGGVVYPYLSRSVGKNGNYIVGLKAPLFKTNGGMLMNVALLGVDVNAPYAAALALDSTTYGVANCFAQGNVHGTISAAGLIYSTDADVQNSYFSGKVSSDGPAAGFVFKSSGNIQDCFAVGEVNSTGAASTAISSFVNEYTMYISNSYSAMKMTGDGKKYAFGVKKSFLGNVKNSYWLKDIGINQGSVTATSGANFVSLNTMGSTLAATLNKGGSSAWSNNRPAYPYPEAAAGKYPYPSLNSQDYYGNWHLPS